MRSYASKTRQSMCAPAPRQRPVFPAWRRGAAACAPWSRTGPPRRPGSAAAARRPRARPPRPHAAASAASHLAHPPARRALPLGMLESTHVLVQNSHAAWRHWFGAPPCSRVAAALLVLHLMGNAARFNQSQAAIHLSWPPSWPSRQVRTLRRRRAPCCPGGAQAGPARCPSPARRRHAATLWARL